MLQIYDYYIRKDKVKYNKEWFLYRGYKDGMPQAWSPMLQRWWNKTEMPIELKPINRKLKDFYKAIL